MLRQIQMAACVSDDARALCHELLANRVDGCIKLYVHYKTLNFRKGRRGLFSSGEYTPLSIVGTRANHVVAFARRLGDSVALVAVPRLVTRLIPSDDQVPLGEPVWQNTRLLLPADIASRDWCNPFTGESFVASRDDGQLSLGVAEIFAHFPIALLSRAGAASS